MADTCLPTCPPSFPKGGLSRMHATRGGRSVWGKLQSILKTPFRLGKSSAAPLALPNVPLLPWDPTTPSILSDTQNGVPPILSNTWNGEPFLSTQHQPEEYPSLSLWTDRPLDVANVGHPNSSLSDTPRSSHSPILISSVNHPSFGGNMVTDGLHLLAVEKVVNALASEPSGDLNMETSSSLLPSDSDLSDAPMEPDDNMTFRHFQKDIKLESLVRKDPSRCSSRLNKGRRNPNSWLSFSSS